MRPAWTVAPIRLAREEIWAAVSSGNGAIPPTWWQPAHFCWITGATSRVKLGVTPGPV
jgi:hypothetical protein